MPNEKEQLWPGQFLAARIVLRIEQEAMVLPEGAVQPGQEGPFVFVVSEGRARVKNVVIDRQIGEQIVLAKGLEGDERVIVEVPPDPGRELSGRGGRRGRQRHQRQG